MFDLQLLAFVAFAAVLTISPGADTLLVARNVVSRGRVDGMMTAVGICSGVFVHAALSALGLSVVLLHSAVAFQVMKIVGACYLVWLGLQTLARVLRGERQNNLGLVSGRGQSLTSGRSLAEGLLTNVLNPKVAIFYLAFLPQFIDVGDPVFAKSILLASIHASMGLIWLGALASVLHRARAVVTRPRARRLLESVSGIALIGLGVRLALQER